MESFSPGLGYVVCLLVFIIICGVCFLVVVNGPQVWWLVLIVNLTECRLSHLGNGPLGMPLGDYLDCVNWHERSILLWVGIFPWQGVLGCIRWRPWDELNSRKHALDAECRLLQAPATSLLEWAEAWAMSQKQPLLPLVTLVREFYYENRKRHEDTR